MTEAEWLRCEDPVLMLASLKGNSTTRKMRLLAAACCRLGGPILTEEWKEAFAVIERFADGIVGDEVLPLLGPRHQVGDQLLEAHTATRAGVANVALACSARASPCGSSGAPTTGRSEP